MRSLFEAKSVKLVFSKYISKYESLFVKITDEKFLNKVNEVMEKVMEKDKDIMDIQSFLKQDKFGEENMMFIKLDKIKGCEDVINELKNYRWKKDEVLNIEMDIIVKLYDFSGKKHGLTYEISNLKTSKSSITENYEVEFIY